MISYTYKIWSEEEYSYPLAFGFVPDIVSYIHDEDDLTRPALVVVPGGGYCVVSPTEGELVALEFYEKGYNTFVLTYTTNYLMRAPLKTQPMNDLSRTIRLLRRNAGEFRINPNRIAICGFSAGGHLCGSLAVHYEDIEDKNELYQGYSNRPDAVILSYPLITAGEKAHKGSFMALLGADASLEELEYMSLEKQVKETTPPAFIWQTATDELVPVDNSYLYAEACRRKAVEYELHIFGKGAHGMSLANDAWASGKFGSFHTMQQIRRIVEKARRGEVEIPEEIMQKFSGVKGDDEGGYSEAIFNGKRTPDPEVAMWPILADIWLKRVMG